MGFVRNHPFNRSPKTNSTSSRSRGRSPHLVADVRLDNRDDLIRLLGIDSISRARAGEVTPKSCFKPGCAGTRDASTRSSATSPSPFSPPRSKADVGPRPVGERPLFFASDPDGVAFASTPQGVCWQSGFARDWIFVRWSMWLQEFVQRPRAISRESRRSQPGECISFTSAQAEIRGHIGNHPSSRSRLKVRMITSRHIERFSDFSRIPAQAPSGPVCSELSSGFDSSAVAATAAISPVMSGDCFYRCSPRRIWRRRLRGSGSRTRANGPTDRR